MDVPRIAEASAKYPPPADFQPSYGTAGFRSDAKLLPATVFRCGLLVAARALTRGAACGLMITASHNPEEDNGVKIVEPSGDMLVPEWEAHATALAQAASDAQLLDILRQIVPRSGAEPGGKQVAVAVGRDTRPSGNSLFEAAVAGISALGVTAVDCGTVTTPQLHFHVLQYNQQGSIHDQDYFDMISRPFIDFMTNEAVSSSSSSSLVVDCANGVGAGNLQRLAPALQQAGLAVEMRNTGSGRLNYRYVSARDAVPPTMDSQLAACQPDTAGSQPWSVGTFHHGFCHKYVSDNLNLCVHLLTCDIQVWRGLCSKGAGSAGWAGRCSRWHALLQPGRRCRSPGVLHKDRRKVCTF